jgi:hypothetical protein
LLQRAVLRLGQLDELAALNTQHVARQRLEGIEHLLVRRGRGARRGEFLAQARLARHVPRQACGVAVCRAEV